MNGFDYPKKFNPSEGDEIALPKLTVRLERPILKKIGQILQEAPEVKVAISKVYENWGDDDKEEVGLDVLVNAVENLFLVLPDRLLELAALIADKDADWVEDNCTYADVFRLVMPVWHLEQYRFGDAMESVAEAVGEEDTE